MAIPRKDTLLVPYSINFNDRIVADPATFQLSALQAAAYTALHTPYIDAVAAVAAAKAEGTRSSSLVTSKDDKKKALLDYGRQLYAFVQANEEVSDENKVLLGVHVRDREPTPKPIPDIPPALKVIKIYGRNIELEITDSVTGEKKKPVGVAGIGLFQFIGAEPPATQEGWVVVGQITKSKVTAVFPEGTLPGAKVWFTAYYYNTRGLSGPPSTPISSNIGFDGSTVLAA